MSQRMNAEVAITDTMTPERRFSRCDREVLRSWRSPSMPPVWLSGARVVPLAAEGAGTANIVDSCRMGPVGGGRLERRSAAEVIAGL